nr:ATP-dependent helicase [Methanoculleus marisnigri]
MSADLIRWTGGPGSGKTYQLLEDVRREVEDGRTLDDMILMTFSRSQAADLADRLSRSVFPGEDRTDILRRCATVDGITLRAVRAAGMISQSPDQIIVPGAKKAIPVYREFMQAAGIPYTPNAYAPDDGDPVARAKLPAGNQILDINAYLSATMQDPAAWQYAASALNLPFDGATWGICDLLPAWQEFKTQRGVFEHADYARLALDERVEPRAPILFVDEYQDLSPLQDALIRQWIEQADRVYVAGDPDQSIYGFRGGRPDLFKSLPAEDRGARDDGNRPISRRCAMRIMTEAERILGRPANVAPNSRPGRYMREIYTHTPEAFPARIEDALKAYPGGPVFVLSRFRRHVSKIARALAAMGIPCSGIRTGTGPWGATRIGKHKETLARETVNVWQLTRAVRRYATGGDTEQIPFEEVEALILATLSPARRAAALTDLKAKLRQHPPIRVGDVARWIPLAPGDRRILALLNLRPALVEQMQACISREDRRGTVIAPEAVRVDTIHAAKGLEAPCVLLHTGYLPGLAPGLADRDRMAEERRIFFVGATRASHALILFDYIAPPWPVFGSPV